MNARETHPEIYASVLGSLIMWAGPDADQVDCEEAAEVVTRNLAILTTSPDWPTAGNRDYRPLPGAGGVRFAGTVEMPVQIPPYLRF